MGILRKDYLLDRWVYYAAERKKRRMEFKEDRVKDVSSSKTCFFCTGNEHLTPKEIGRVEYKNIWKIRWFPNKFPVVELKGNAKLRKNKFLMEGKNYGTHEVIAETADHKKQLADLSVEHIKEILDVYILRIKTLSKIKGTKYVAVFKNKGPQAGTSLVHAHTQVASLPLLPDDVMDEVKAVKKFRIHENQRFSGRRKSPGFSSECPYCNIIKLESKSKRKIMENKSIIAFAPFASRFNFEAWLFPKRHVKSITSMYDNELYDMASALKKILLKLKKINASYNFFLHYAPKGENLHFHIEITPRIAKWGGFELSTGAIINSVMPEDAAKFYRSK
jgi:UDPglucose--hexose-1-phosphate uridylyltransferase